MTRHAQHDPAAPATEEQLTVNLAPFDILLTGATILTAEADRPEIHNGAIGIAGGRIAWIGEGVPPAAEAGRVLDLAGHVVTPGFVNVHAHSILTMVRGVAADSGFAPS